MTAPLHDEERDETAEDIRRDEENAGRPAELFYPNVGEFVEDRFIYFVPRPTPRSGRVWCPEWYRHAEALARLDAVWRAWEALRWDPGLGMSNWWLHHADPHVRALTDPVTGPFARCVAGHQDHEPLPIATPPEGLFTDQRSPVSRDPFALD
ncbi:DUF4913 domain-containing protein [Streptomyces brasiliensis]|uniref:DUF4913 domain-containing protein n=1 Tax=Streptomyces brasiliensis TaxID=1954 RepID=A0A917KV09_9ACTN|nr:DUF4913 domain-containing protein [Streptomyces brasiliensis]GGJ26140.1 hypothetical protein GCM10010121_041580 [Streptomyces brasiliensis]